MHAPQRFAIALLATALALPATWSPPSAFELIAPQTERSITTVIGTGQLIRVDSEFASLFVANPDVADIEVKSPRLLYLTGVGVGETTLFALDENDAVLMSANITVTHNTGALQRGIARVAPGQSVSATTVDQSLVLTGEVASPEVAANVVQVASQFVDDPSRVVNRLTIAAAIQVNLQVRIAEIKRNVDRQLGIRWNELGYSDGNINIGFAAALLAFVVVAGGLVAFLTNAGTTIAGYAEYILPLSNPVGREDSTFYHSWTIFFWAWWISWSPFVGMFIARVSRGRTVREFLTAVLIVPTVVTTIWMTAFGGNGIDQVADGVGELAGGIGDSSLALFQMLPSLPLAGVTSVLAIILVLVFFITSSDSGPLVIDGITAGGKTDSPRAQRLTVPGGGVPRRPPRRGRRPKEDDDVPTDHGSRRPAARRQDEQGADDRGRPGPPLRRGALVRGGDRQGPEPRGEEPRAVRAHY